jgi:hypothetical protein
MPKTVVVGSTGVTLLGYSLFSGMAAFLTAGAFSEPRVDKLTKEVYGEELARDEPRSGWRGTFRKYGGYVTVIPLAGLAPFVFEYGFVLESLNDYALYFLYLGAAISGGVLCAFVRVPTTLEAAREAPWWTDLAGAAILYGGILLGAVSLTGITPPSLPNVHFYDAQAEIEDGRLLTHSEGYWYVLTDKGIRAISDKEAGNELRITEPNPY